MCVCAGPACEDYFKLCPDAGVEYISKYINIFYNGQCLKCPCAGSHEHTQQCPYIGIKVRSFLPHPCPHGQKRIEAARFRVILQIIVGIQKVDIFSHVKAHPAKRFLPDIVFTGEELCHQIAEAGPGRIGRDFL